MIYKKHEFSLSQNGKVIMHIARNAIGNVIFRAESESELKNMIDDAILEEEKLIAKKAQRQAELEEKKLEKKKRGLFQSKVEDVNEVEVIKEDEIQTPIESPSARVTRGSDGKFISKSQLDQVHDDDDEDQKKKSFWDKLTS